MEKRVKLAVMLVLLCFSLFLNANFFVPTVRAWIPLEGHITQDTTLAVTTEPYRVVKDVIVDAGVTLTIEPGVTVEFADDLSLIVYGNLYAVGTTDGLINFTSSRPNPSPGVWDTIKFIGGKTESFTIKYSVITYAKNGITVATEDGRALIEKCEISNNSDSGIMLVGKSNVVIKENTIKLNINGISTDNSATHSGIIATSNLIFSNQDNGIYLYGDGGYTYDAYIYNVTVSNNVVSSNGNGIQLHSYIPSIFGGEQHDAYIYDVVVSDNVVSSNHGDGIYLNSLGGDDVSYLYDVVVSDNVVSSNGANGIHLRSYGGEYWSYQAYFYNVTVSDNVVSSNHGDGIYLNSLGGHDASYFYNVTVSNNVVSSNNGIGIHLRSYSDRDRGGYLYDVVVSNNSLLANFQEGIRTSAKNHYTNLMFDLSILKNVMTRNAVGAHIFDGIRTNLTGNSIGYNEFGIQYRTTTNNLAEYNDIYYNSYGMYVFDGATVNAEYNYWGDATGPYHVSLNPEGKGNPVNGDGTDLDFIPFNSSSFGPIIDLESLTVVVSLAHTSIGSGGEVSVGVHVTNGTDAVDDVLVQLASDKGGSFSLPSGNTDSNGDFDSTYTAPSVSEQTAVKITATASKLGYNDGSDYKYVTVYPPDTLFLSVTVAANPSQVQSSGTSTITVRVTDGINAVSDATVTLWSNKGGSLSPTSGTTNANGYFTSTYTAPSVTTETTTTITANATKTGYIDGQGQTQITVNPGPPPEEDSPLWIYLAILIIILAIIVGIVAIARRKRHKPETKEQEIQKPTSPQY